jgi:hypothetical protein
MTAHDNVLAMPEGTKTRMVVVFGPSPALGDDWVAVEQDADGPFDAVLITAPVNPSAFLGWLYDSASPLAPVIDLAGGTMARADLTAPIATSDMVVTGLSKAVEIAGRLSAMAPIPLNQDRDGLIILGLASSRSTVLKPVLDASHRALYSYPVLDGIADAPGWLETLAHSGLMSRTFHDRVYICPQCQSARLSVREVCPACKSTNVAEESLVHHYRCGMQGPRSAFLKGQTLVCPKCNDVLRHFGVDYDTPGQVFACAACGGTATEPEISFLCADCGAVTTGAAAQRRDWHVYRLTEAGEVAAIEGRLPGTRLSSMMASVHGWRSPPEMAMLINLCMGLKKRYTRPFMVATLTLTDPDTVIARTGRGGLARLHRLLVDLVAETVRNTDGVAILGDRIIICLPETPPENGPFLAKRLRERLDKAVADASTVRIAVLPEEEVPALEAELTQS